MKYPTFYLIVGICKMFVITFLITSKNLSSLLNKFSTYLGNYFLKIYLIKRVIFRKFQLLFDESSYTVHQKPANSSMEMKCGFWVHKFKRLCRFHIRPTNWHTLAPVVRSSLSDFNLHLNNYFLR